MHTHTETEPFSKSGKYAAFPHRYTHMDAQSPGVHLCAVVTLARITPYDIVIGVGS